MGSEIALLFQIEALDDMRHLRMKNHVVGGETETRFLVSSYMQTITQGRVRLDTATRKGLFASEL